jgi:hypothetical protein
MPFRCALFVLAALTLVPSASAQTYTAAADFLFYGDNTEFANPFREGETLLGVQGRVYLDVAISDQVTLRGGFFGSGRFALHGPLDSYEPVVALEIANGWSRFVFGSLHTVQTGSDIAGPDRETLHGLLPPIQDERLTFTRGQEMGLQWLVTSKRFDHDTWINWQRLNTAESRERFDAGYRGRVALKPALALHGQWHIVHEGGQQFDAGPVSDSQAGALGFEWTVPVGALRLRVDAHAVGTRSVPDRERLSLVEAGAGIFARSALTRGAWRGHLIVWRGHDALKEEGDANYLMRRRDGRLDRKIRDYGEFGITRVFTPAPTVSLMAGFRLHRVDARYEYSYRLVGRVQMRQPL